VTRRGLLPLLVLALALTAQPAAAAKGKPCARKGSVTVKSTKLVRVFEVANREGGDNLYACLRSNGRRQLLTRSYDDDYVTSGSYDRVKVAGRFVAWQFTATDISCKAGCPPGYDSTTADLHVRNLRERKTQDVAGEVASDGRLVLTNGGAIAWTERPDGAPIEVNSSTIVGPERLDSGDGIVPGSLRLQGRTAFWENAGETKSAELFPKT
jgi:hypothetical protein